MKNNFTASHMIHHQQKPKNVKESDKVLFSVHFDRSLLTRLIFMLMIMSCLLSLTTKKHRKQQQQQQNDYFQHNQCRNQCDDDTSLFKWNVDVVDNDVNSHQFVKLTVFLFFRSFDGSFVVDPSALSLRNSFPEYFRFYGLFPKKIQLK
ncbi:hypothetical protein DERP_010465 [Dermatophagoides pteronyssinus]|uniref:Uncharacterized protein n=1 Tax=Dermatophagoides pteronyssinus TaxID=6956 RepID=A0ABQ8J530_DERPT|nr:hypothetical protein DERP_010465 [Dermatophagoides pteronyssinus]